MFDIWLNCVRRNRADVCPLCFEEWPEATAAVRATVQPEGTLGRSLAVGAGWKCFQLCFVQPFLKSFSILPTVGWGWISLRSKCFFYCSNAITKKLDTMKIPLDLV